MRANPLSAMLIPIAVLSIVAVLTVGKIFMDGINWYRMAVLVLSAAGSLVGIWTLIGAARPRQVKFTASRGRS